VWYQRDIFRDKIRKKPSEEAPGETPHNCTHNCTPQLAAVTTTKNRKLVTIENKYLDKVRKKHFRKGTQVTAPAPHH